MKPSLSTFFTLAVRASVAALVLAAAPTWAGPTTVPFKARLSTIETLGAASRCPNSGLPFNAGTTHGTGQASHLGAVTLNATDCITLNPSTGTFSFREGMFTLTAANGDQLTAKYEGELVPTSPTSSVYIVDGEYEIIGGTGRFSDAEGKGTLSGALDLHTNQGKFIASGTLTY